MTLHRPGGTPSEETREPERAEDGQRERVSMLRLFWLTLEMLALFVLTPIAVYSLLYDYRIPLFTLLPTVFVVFILLLTLDRTFSWRQLLAKGIGLRDLASIAVIFAIAGPALVLFAYQDVPERVLRLYNLNYDLWLRIVILYSLLSVPAQEIMYRVFFFHRYRPLFAGDRQAGIMLNAVLFSFSHIIFQSVETLIISFLGGLLFAWRYESSRSFLALVLEHALYGSLIFTVGLGRYFYTGVSNF